MRCYPSVDGTRSLQMAFKAVMERNLKLRRWAGVAALGWKKIIHVYIYSYIYYNIYIL
jgi:LDH2 family malate/lactate/ureidoglycolate dehydrogenase